MESFPDDQVFLYKLKKNGLIFLRYATCISPIMHLICPPPPQILHNLCFSFLLGITTVPREIENNANAKFWGANKVHYGRCASGVYLFLEKPQFNQTFRLCPRVPILCKCIQQIQTYPFTNMCH